MARSTPINLSRLINQVQAIKAAYPALYGIFAEIISILNDDESLFIADSNPPDKSPSGGLVLYSEDGVLKYKKSDGTIVTP